MPTDSLQSILYRELATANAKPLIQIASPLLRELVNFGTNALVRCATSTKGKVNEDLAVLSLYRHILEMTDGVEVLISQACAMPSIPLVRSSFEALISMEYIVQSDTEYVRRSLSWLVGYMHQKIEMYERLDPSTTRGADFQKAIQQDESVPSLLLPPKTEIDKVVNNLSGLLSDPQFASINQDFLSLPGWKAWYRLYGGPNDLRELSYRVGRSAFYDFMYRYWSRVSHAHDFGPFIAKDPKGRGVIRPIRDPQELKEVANFAATIMIAATRKLITKFRPDETIANWYKRDVRPLYTQLYSR